MKKLVLVLIVLALVGACSKPYPETEGPVNIDEGGLMLEGYDVMEFFRYNVQKGSNEFYSDYNGARYLFCNEKNKQLFDSAPFKYAPRFGGYCAVAVAYEKALKPVEIWSYSIVNGKLIFNHNRKAYDYWIADVQGGMSKAEKNWKSITEEFKSNQK